MLRNPILFACATALALILTGAEAFAGAATQISVGSGHACVRTPKGAIACWGWNAWGQLGDGTTITRSEPVAVPGFSFGVAAVEAGGAVTCALHGMGALSCWGYNERGALGDGTNETRSVPAPVSGLGSPVLEVAVGNGHVCALSSVGQVLCWGANSEGQLGDGTTIDRNVPVPVQGLPPGIARIAAGRKHTCAATSQGALWCWGDDTLGQLGDGQTDTIQSLPVEVSGLTGVLEVSLGNDHSCAIAGPQRAAWCWGSDQSGQLGNEGYDSPVPVPVAGLSSGIASIDAGVSHTCALDAQGHALCWGSNAYGETGNGEFYSPFDLPVLVSGLGAGNTAIEAGAFWSCAITAMRGVRCWGDNNIGQLGDGSHVSGPTPVAPSGLSSGVAAISQGPFSLSCALRVAGDVRCWGEDWILDAVAGERSLPLPIGNLSGPATSVTISCAIVAGGRVECWTTAASAAPVAGFSSGALGVASSAHSCAIAAGGALRCWGGNFYGQLGNGTTQYSTTPVNVIGLGSGVASVSTGGSHTCAVTTAGAALCWGQNWAGQLGDGTWTGRLTPVPVFGLGSGVAAVSAGAEHTCARMTSGAVKCWGYNSDGRLGNGTNDQSYVPVGVTGLSSGALAVSAGGSHTCALRADGGVSCWGDNFYGQIGASSQFASLVPVAVGGLTEPMVAVSAGFLHTCALGSSGGMLCWGSNISGEYGDGSRPFSRVPVPVIGFEGAAEVPALAAPWLLVLAVALLGAPRIFRSSAWQ